MTATWFACSEPERPTDALVRWHYEDCRACHIKADVLVAMHPADSHVQWLRDHVAEPATKECRG